MWKTWGVADFFAPFSGAIQYTVSRPLGLAALFVASATVFESCAMAFAWSATSGEQSVVGWLALISAAHLFMSCVYFSTDGGLKSIPMNAATAASTTPMPPAIFLFFGSMSLSMKIRTMSGRKAITVMMAPSWF